MLCLSVFTRAKLGHGLLSGQYSKPPVKSELIEQVMKEEYKVGLSGLLFALSLGTKCALKISKKKKKKVLTVLIRTADVNYKGRSKSLRRRAE